MMNYFSQQKCLQTVKTILKPCETTHMLPQPLMLLWCLLLLLFRMKARHTAVERQPHQNQTWGKWQPILHQSWAVGKHLPWLNPANHGFYHVFVAPCNSQRKFLLVSYFFINFNLHLNIILKEAVAFKPKKDLNTAVLTVRSLAAVAKISLNKLG